MNDHQDRVSAAAFVVAGLSFIPLVGVPFGIAAVGWGLATQKVGGKLVALLGAGGIAFTILIYGGLFYFGFVHRGGIFDDLHRQMAQSQLDALVPAVEFYKVGNGNYPASLKEVQEILPKTSFISVLNSSSMKLGAPRYFFYERVGTDHYYLRSVGPDGIPFTADDVVPQVHPSFAGKIGLLIDKR